MEAIHVQYALTRDDLDEWARSAKPAKGSGASRLRSELVGWLMFIGLAALLFLVSSRSHRPATQPAGPASNNFLDDVLAPIMPWLVIFGFIGLIWFFASRPLRAKGKRVWDANEDLRQPHVAVFDDLGVTVTGPKVSMRVLWSGFDAWSETANLFLLRQQPGDLYHIVPKRAVPAGQDEPLRDLLRARVGGTTGGFPVVPAGPRA